MNTPPDSNETIYIHVTNSQALEERIDAAVSSLQEKAIGTGTRGILLIRDGPGKYTAALSDQVPFGITRELMR
ncbi:hypothetical protein [Arthrobacter sp. ISL-72]|uniref:hypothetical protein n=1 Tax=Arthrobacter sp. ISL-72 TaxID=2819114 RepID=UPI001BE50901|nr:hypothetical protein [Arthrobacter sp. ISL-72]MBT2594031.1 hypothetical protein [Arthrobacter sp. ISL-72]